MTKITYAYVIALRWLAALALLIAVALPVKAVETDQAYSTGEQEFFGCKSDGFFALLNHHAQQAVEREMNPRIIIALISQQLVAEGYCKHFAAGTAYRFVGRNDSLALTQLSIRGEADLWWAPTVHLNPVPMGMVN